MVRLAANLTMLFREHPFLERFDRAADAGFTGVEFFFPYSHDASDIAEALSRNGLDLVLYNFPVGDYDAGERGIAAMPERRDEFRAGVAAAVEYGTALHPLNINTPSGPAPDDPSHWDELVDNMRYAAEQLQQIGVGAVIEPINRGDVAGALVSTTARATTLVTQVAHANLGIQYDLYHSLQSGEDPFVELDAHLPHIHHIQIADVPGRHQPGTGAQDFDRLIRTLDNSGYEGWMSLEYHPHGPTADSFQFFQERGLLSAR